MYQGRHGLFCFCEIPEQRSCCRGSEEAAAEGSPSPQAVVGLLLQLGLCGTSPGETRHQPRELLIQVCPLLVYVLLPELNEEALWQDHGAEKIRAKNGDIIKN